MQELPPQPGPKPRELEISTLGYRPPGGVARTVAVLVLDPRADCLWIQFPDDIRPYVKPDDLDYFEVLAQDLKTKASDFGAANLITHLEESLSNVLLISDRKRVTVTDPTLVLERSKDVFGLPFPALDNL